MSSRANLSDSFEYSAKSGNVPGVLPLRGDIKPVYLSSLVIAFLIAVSAGGGLLFHSRIYPTEKVLLAFVAVDAFHLVVGLPILLVSMGLARRGRVAALLCWPGVLLYVLYSYTTNLLGVPFGPLFLPYLLLIVLSAYTTIALVAAIDGKAVRRRLEDAVPARFTGWLLVVLTALFVLMALSGIVSAAASRRVVDPMERMLWIADLATISPACILGGILLLRRKTLGYVGGTGLLLAYSMLFIGLLPVLVFPALYDGTPIDWTGFIMMLAAGVLCLVPLARFIRATTQSS